MKYITLLQFKAYLRDQQAFQTDTDTELTWAVGRAEEAIDCFCGTQFQAQNLTHEQPRAVWVNSYGGLVCQMHYPITAVTAIDIMDRYTGHTDWQTTVIKEAFVETLADSPIMANYRFEAILSSPGIGARPTGAIRARVTYTAGYSTIPQSLAGITARAAHFYYLQRDAPNVTTVSAELGVMQVPLDLPPDVTSALMSWRNLSA